MLLFLICLFGFMCGYYWGSRKMGKAVEEELNRLEKNDNWNRMTR